MGYIEFKKEVLKMSKRLRNVGNVVVCPSEEPIAHEKNEVQARIRQRAFEISLNRGHAGREIDDWLSAESEVIMSPPVEIAEKDGTFILRMAAPGIDPAELTILTTRNRLLVKADFRHDHESGAAIHSCEFKSLTLFRSIDFPGPIDVRSLGSELDDGMLRVTARRQGMAEAPAPKKKPARKAAARKKTNKE
jgi:HSP20 family molecular chaperone IbpA